MFQVILGNVCFCGNNLIATNEVAMCRGSETNPRHQVLSASARVWTFSSNSSDPLAIALYAVPQECVDRVTVPSS